MTSSPIPADRSGPLAIAFVALVAGAVAMGISPIFVRFAEVGPFASAFWRVALALPALWIWARFEQTATPALRDPGADRALILAGFLFAGDLTFWHLAIVNTSVANATLLATLAPVWVVIGSGLFLGERVGRAVFLGLAFCLVGAAMLVGSTLSVSPENLVGDLYGLITSFFFGTYFLAVRRARRQHGSGRILFVSGIVTALFLLAQAVALEPVLWPAAPAAIAALVALALVSHVGGQGLLALALGTLPAAFSSLVIFLEALAAASFGWLILGEAIGPLQAAGAAVILLGVYVARPQARHRRTAVDGATAGDPQP